MSSGADGVSPVAGVRIEKLLAQARAALPSRPGAEDLAALRARQALIVDIRPSELRERDGEMPGAVVIDRNVLEWRLDREIVVICDEGYASSIAALSLQRLGLRRATDLDGGFQAVLAAQSIHD